MKRFRIFLIVAALVLLIDQISKAWIRAALPLNGERDLLPGWVHLSHVLNHGAAWGVLSGQRWLLVGVAIVVAGGVVMVAREIGARSAWANIGLALIFGGALGNLIDRIAKGAVTDFIDLDTPWRWLQTFPVWNGADAALTIGVILIAIDFLRGEKIVESEASPASEMEAAPPLL